MAVNYKKRLVEGLLELNLKTMGGVLIQGSKACGKTTTAEQFAKSKLMLADERVREEAQGLIDIGPELLIAGEAPRLIDEWQVFPKLWDLLRYEIDKRDGFGQFILTGSAVPADRSGIIHSGTGRFAWVTMRPMTLVESGESSGAISLKSIFDGRTDLVAENKLLISDIGFVTCRGGWPRAIGFQGEEAFNFVRNFVRNVINVDVTRASGKACSKDRMRMLLQSLARNVGTQTSLNEIHKDLTSDAPSLSTAELTGYVQALRDIFVIEDMPAWNPNLRSKTAIRTTPTRYFCDPSIAAASLGVRPEALFKDRKTFGFVFENLCVRDLRVYAETLSGDVFHYRDKTNLECDAVIHLDDGRYGLIEIKLGGNDAVEQGVKTLKALAAKINVDRMSEPSFLMVLTAVGQFAFRRKDGVWVVPIGCLGP